MASTHDLQMLESLKRRLREGVGDMYVDGRFRAARSGRTFDVEDPATGEVIAAVADGDESDIHDAVQAARRAFTSGPWPAMSAAQRADLLLGLADAIEAHREELILLEALDTGHPVETIRKNDFVHSLHQVRENAGWATKIVGEVPMTAAGVAGFSYWTREPVGVVGLITPWNAPMLMLLQKVAPALAAGCTVVAKPAELAPLSALRIAELADALGFPAGVLNVVPGEGAIAGRALAESSLVNKISFTGSTATGKAILAASASSNLKRVTLELGGKSPIAVFADADLDKAARAVAHESMFKAGQYCAAGTRLYVAESIADEFNQLVIDAMDQIEIGPGYEVGPAAMGPMISGAQRERAHSIIMHSVEEGARVLRGGRPCDRPGYFYEPTLLTAIKPGMRVLTDEIFGPALISMSFPDDVGLGELAGTMNDSPYGLAAKVWSSDLGTVHRLARLLEAGVVVVNGGGGEGPLPFGGFKQSGFGREYGRVGLEEYTEIKSVRLGF